MFGMSKPAKPAKPAKAKEQPPAAEAPEQADETAVDITLALSPAHIDKLRRLGGAGWIAAQIDKARVTKGR